MQLYSTHERPPWSAELVCRQSRAVAVVGAAVGASLLVGIPLTLWYLGVLPWWVGLAIGAGDAAILPIFAGSMFATLRRTNWLVALDVDGLWIQVRSYQNYRLPPGRTVVHLRYVELAGARQQVVRLSAPTHEGTMTWKEVSLDLKLRQPVPQEVKQEIAQERGRKRTSSLLGGRMMVTGRSNHVPVTVPEEDVIRVAWRSRYDLVRPALKHVLRKLSRHVPVLDATSQDYPADWNQLTDQQVDDLVLRFVESGDRFSAIQLLERRRNYTTTDARQFVDGLTDRLADRNQVTAIG